MDKIMPTRYMRTGMSDSGGFGEVVICTDNHLDRLVAIKSLSNPIEKHRMLDEVGALLSLRSKHVVQLYDVITHYDGEVSIVEEFIDGPNLFDKSEDINDEKKLINYLWQISSGIADIHAHGIIHRDIKPNNMKVDAEGIVKIFDFGLSRRYDEAATVGFVGTYIYAAPEQCVNGTVKFSYPVDTFAFGVTALCLSGVPLPDALRNPQKIIPANPFVNSRFPISEYISATLYSCLHLDPESRPKMADVRDALQRHILFNSHKAYINHNGVFYILDVTHPTVSLKVANVGEIEIKYNGYEFYIARISGEVYINNRTPIASEFFPHSCVIIIGSQARRSNQRSFITFDISHPEVVL
ncbi:serine/threonine-protein kinase [Rahnella aceris]|uniref:serine/threonine-protein kinase n=1 Tax=Rahnella sp. (strain Y9602) TaxID=2703885 RepID=UPI003FD69632